MTIYTFQSYPAVTAVTFDCPQCGKAKRKRTFRAECTVNPFNKNEDGSVKSPSEVRKQSQSDASRQADEFRRKPMCATCENALSYQERRELARARRLEAEARKQAERAG